MRQCLLSGAGMFLPCLYCNGASRFFADAQNDRILTFIVILNGAVRRSEGSDKGKRITDNFRINYNENKKDFMVCGCPVNGSGGVVCLQQG